MLLGLENSLHKEGIKLVPKKIQPYFKMTLRTKDGDNSLIEGLLACCNTSDF